jgi:hypothetical protein
MTPLDIHRRLDEAFAGIEMTPELQDLKEEMRADLVARVAEAEESGVAPADAALAAIASLGDVRAVIDELRTIPGALAPQRVRPRPGYVLRTLLWALLGLAAVAGVAVDLLADAVIDAGWLRLSLVGVVGLVGGVIVADALRQDTTASYPLPWRRAAGFGVAAGLGVSGLTAGLHYLPTDDLRWPIAGAVPVLAAIVWFTYLGSTQTNRYKPWVARRQAAERQLGDRFEQDPVVAARFGVYTVVIGLVSATGFAAVGLAVGWTWSWLALVLGAAVFMLTLARMLFVPTGRA